MLTCPQAKAHVESLLARSGEGLMQVVEVLKGSSLRRIETNVVDMIGHMAHADEDDIAGDGSEVLLSRRRYILQGLVDSLT